MTTLSSIAKGLGGGLWSVVGKGGAWVFSHVRLIIEYAMIAAMVALAGLYVAQRIHGLQLDTQVQKLTGDAQLADGTIKVLAQANVDQDAAIAGLKELRARDSRQIQSLQKDFKKTDAASLQVKAKLAALEKTNVQAKSLLDTVVPDVARCVLDSTPCPAHSGSVNAY
jgi:hypothetical protein